MSSKDYLRGHSSTPKAPGTDTSWAAENPGPYIGVVKNNTDPLRMGRLQVNIPALSKTTDPTASNLITCEYLSPFYGAKDANFNQPGSTKYTGSQHSYGFWAVPPDIGTRVLVIFAEGKIDQGFWIGCVQEPVTNHMIPGIAASEKTWDKSSGGPAGKYSSSVDKRRTYGTLNVPSGELNRATPESSPLGDYDSFNKPIHPLADILATQGLIGDDVRGTTTSSARRESPSQVFGFSTPGPKDLSSTKQLVGAKDDKKEDWVARGIGHTFVMDDGDEQGENQLTRLRTASGHQLLMHDTEGVVYIANGSGKSWLEMSPEGKIYIYAQDGFNLRGDGNFDLHSGADINFHAKNDIKFTAEGSVVNNAEGYVMSIGKQGIFSNTTEGSIRFNARDGISSYTEGTQLWGAKGQIHLAGQQVHFNSTIPQPTWGPSWLTPEQIGIITDESQNDVNITVGPGEILEANTRKTKTTINNLVTHEPFTRAPSGVVETVTQFEDPDEWKRLSQTPGTLEYMAQKNRESKNAHVRELQYFTDLERYTMNQNKPASLKNVPVSIGKFASFAKTNVKMKKNFKLNKSDIKTLQDAGVYDAREVYRTGQTPEEYVQANSKVMASKMEQTLNDMKDAFPGINKAIEGIKDGDLIKLDTSAISSDLINSLKNGGGFKLDTFAKNLDVGRAKEIAGQFAGQYNEIYNVATSIPNLSKDQIGGIMISKVTGGHLTSLSKEAVFNAGTKYLTANAGKFFSRGSANNIPPSLRGTAKGRIMQGATSIKDHIGSLASKFKTGGLSGGFAAIGQGLKKFFSDQRLKENIEKIGVSPQGINIYQFKYKHSDGTYQGVMAQEVPWASEITDTGFLAVDYSKVDVEFRRVA